MFNNATFEIDNAASFNEHACRNLAPNPLKANTKMQSQPITLVRPAKPRTPATPQRWSVEAIEELFKLPFSDLLFQAQQVHREHFDPNAVQLSTLLSIKTGGCSEDCGYCPQAARYHTGVDATKLMSTDAVVEKARQAKAAGLQVVMNRCMMKEHYRLIGAKLDVD